MAENQQVQLDLGYQALYQESWEEADRVFRELLQEEPENGLACLGRALAAKRLTGREALAENWEQLQQDPQFQQLLEPAPPDFLQWLRQDMAAAIGEEPGPDPVPESLPLSPGRKLLLGFAGTQVVLWLLAVVFLIKSMRYSDDFLLKLLAGAVILGAMGGPSVILSGFYGNSIVEEGRFRRLLKILNNLAAILGGSVSGILTAAFYESFQSGAGDLVEDRYSCIAYGLIFLIHLLALIIPMFLGRAAQD